MLPLGEVDMSVGLRDQFVIAMSLDLAEENVAVRHRAKRIQGGAGCWGWGGFLDTIDVNLDPVVAAVFLGVSRYFFGMGHIGLRKARHWNPQYGMLQPRRIWTAARKFIFLAAVSGILVQMPLFRSIMN
jgi:hypothetical protein